MRSVAVYACEAMADWQVAYVTTGLTIHRRINPDVPPVVVAGCTTAPITTLGGLVVTPTAVVDDLDPDDVAALVLPGGDRWDEGHDDVLRLAGTLYERGTVVAAICASTLALARVGLLDEAEHTSNSATRLQQTGYAGASAFVDAPVVRDGQVITARGTAPVAFAYEIFSTLQTLPREHLDLWRRHMNDRGPRA